MCGDVGTGAMEQVDKICKIVAEKFWAKKISFFIFRYEAMILLILFQGIGALITENIEGIDL